MKQYNKLEEFQVFEEDNYVDNIVEDEKLIISFLSHLVKSFFPTENAEDKKINIFLKEKNKPNSSYTRYYYITKPLQSEIEYPSSLFINEMYLEFLIRYTTEFPNKFEILLKHIIKFNNNDHDEKNVCDFSCEFNKEKIIKYAGASRNGLLHKDRYKGEFNPLVNKLQTTTSITKNVKNSGIF